jgi:nicotinate-nucleotide adenylyltransferase
MRNNIKRLGISGGTFDPIHYGHLIVAEDIREKLGLDRVLFIPSGKPPHKDDAKVTDASMRFEMVKRAISGNRYFEVSRIEIDRPGYTYTIDTLRELRKLYGEDTCLFFITGADVVKELLTWKECELVFQLSRFVAVLRPGHCALDFAKDIEVLKHRYGAVIHTVEAPLIGISSTIIRERMTNGFSIRYLVPESVEDFICANNLYNGVKSNDKGRNDEKT